jgi:hypothetical protein
MLRYVDEKAILAAITELVDEEHRLRAAVEARTITPDDEHERLRMIEQHLDQCWDLLRRRRAAQENRQDPEAVEPRPAGQVSTYLQ